MKCQRGRRKVRRNQNSNIEKSNKNITPDKMSIINQILAVIVGILTAGYPIVNGAYNIIYQMKCEEFYQVPAKYFNGSINYRLLYLGCILLLSFAFIYPVFIKNSEEKQEKVSKLMIGLSIFLAVLMGMMFGMLNIYNLLYIIKELYDEKSLGIFLIFLLNNYPYLSIFVVIITGLISVVGVTLINEIKSIKVKILKNVILSILMVSLIFSVMLLIYGTIANLQVSPEDKIRYEIVTSNSENYIVLSEYENKILVVNYEIKEGQVILKTNEYWCLDKFECTYNYIELSVPPVIESQ